MASDSNHSTNGDRFDDDLDQSFQGVRGALTELLTAVGADIERPQEVARRFGLNKNLAWKLSKIVSTTDPHGVISNMPGPIGMNTIFAALRRAKAPKAEMDRARDALAAFDKVVEMHIGDRSTLELVLSSKAPHKVPTEYLHKTRKMAFQGNSSIWGIQARVRLASFFLAPNAEDPEMLDTASMGGLIDVRRLRPTSTVPILVRFAYNDDGTRMATTNVEPIDPSRDGDELMLMPEFCSQPLPEFVPVRRDGYTRYQLAPGPIGNDGLNTWISGEKITRFAPIYSDAANRFGEHSAMIQVPAEWVICDLQVHRDLAFALSPRAMLHSQLMAEPAPETETGESYERLPMAERIESIGQRPPVAATPLVPNYSAMVERVYDRMGWRARDFHGFRVVMRYPPMPTALIIQHDLATPR